MAVFRVERNRGYTVMSNHHLRNRGLTLKAKGLLSQMLSLPDNWDYTLAGLSRINRESIDAIRTAVWELEKAGYIWRWAAWEKKPCCAFSLTVRTSRPCTSALTATKPETTLAAALQSLCRRA